MGALGRTRDFADGEDWLRPSRQESSDAAAALKPWPRAISSLLAGKMLSKL